MCVCVRYFSLAAVFTLCTKQCQKFSVHHYLDKRMQEIAEENRKYTEPMKEIEALSKRKARTENGSKNKIRKSSKILKLLENILQMEIGIIEIKLILLSKYIQTIRVSHNTPVNMYRWKWMNTNFPHFFVRFGWKKSESVKKMYGIEKSVVVFVMHITANKKVFWKQKCMIFTTFDVL